PAKCQPDLAFLRSRQRALAVESPERQLGMGFAHPAAERAITSKQRVHLANLRKNAERKNGDSPRRIRRIPSDCTRSLMSCVSRSLIGERTNFGKYGAARRHRKDRRFARAEKRTHHVLSRASAAAHAFRQPDRDIDGDHRRRLRSSEHIRKARHDAYAQFAALPPRESDDPARPAAVDASKPGVA